MAVVQYRPLPADEGASSWPVWYRAGDDGSIWSNRKRGRFGGTGPWRELRPSRLPNGTLKVSLMVDDIKRTARSIEVDICVCRAFHGPRPIGCTPLHFPDPDAGNCRADNLRWAPRGTSQLGRDQRAGQGRPEMTGHRGRGAHLSDLQVLAAREACAQGQTAGDVAKALGVARHVVDLAVRGVTYRDLPGAIPERPTRAMGTDVSLAKIDELVVMEIREAAARGETNRSIATRLGLSYGCVWSVLVGRTWRHVGG